jgi:hypothetical protein
LEDEMNYAKLFVIVAVAAVAMMAFAAGSASATTLEVNNQTTNSAVTVTASLEPETSLITRDTNNLTQETCTESHIHGTTVPPYTGASVGFVISSFSYGGCTHTTHVLANGNLSISNLGGTTNGTVSASGSEVTVKSTVFGVSIVCKTGAGTDTGLLTGKSSGDATLDVNAVINCGSFVPTAKLEGSSWITSPTPFGVSE